MYKQFMSSLFTKSKRQRLIYIMISIWFIMGIVAIVFEASLVELSAYYSAGSVPVLGYIWGETSRPSGGSKDPIV